MATDDPAASGTRTGAAAPASTRSRISPRPNERPYRGALIGVGGVATGSHLPGFAADPALAKRLEIVVGVDPATEASAGDTLDVVPSIDQLTGYAPLDFVDICTPTGSHVELATWALGQGYHVLCEKPVAARRADAATMIAAARRAGRVLMPCHQHRFNPAWQQMQRWIHDGEIGHWHLAELAVYRQQADVGAARGSTPWRTFDVGGGGGILMDHGTHLLYALMDAAGEPPSSVQTWARRLRHANYASSDTVHVTLEFHDRAATIMLTWAASHRENRVRFIGDRGTIDWRGGVLNLERTGREPETVDFTRQLDKRSYALWFAELFAQFASAMDAGSAPQALHDIERVAAVLEAAEQSARVGARVALP